MSESNVSGEIYKEFHQITRKLTYATISLVCITALLVWLNGIDVRGKHLSEMGLLFMLLAYFTFKIPYISFRYMQKKYRSDPEKSTAIGHDWKTFNDHAMQRK